MRIANTISKGGSWQIFLIKLKSLSSLPNFQKNANDHKAIFSICNRLLNRWAHLLLPERASMQDLANEFNMFFVEKLTKVTTISGKDNAEGEPYLGCEKRHSLPDSANWMSLSPLEKQTS